MAIKILHNNETGKGLEYVDSKLNVKADNTGNVQFEVTDAGIKGNVTFPAATDLSPLEGKVAALEAKDTALEAKDSELAGKVAALEARQDIKLAGAVVEGTNLKLTTSDNVEIVVDLATFMQTVPSAADMYAQVKNQIIADVKAAIKGEEVQDFGGNTKGFLISA